MTQEESYQNPGALVAAAQAASPRDFQRLLATYGENRISLTALSRGIEEQRIVLFNQGKKADIEKRFEQSAKENLLDVFDHFRFNKKARNEALESLTATFERSGLARTYLLAVSMLNAPCDTVKINPTVPAPAPV